ncbi:MAG: class I adenylate-forming enzyme family protein [Candidatus Omnitrophota bacterium]
MNIPLQLETQCKKFSSKPAFIYKDQNISFCHLRDTVFQLANALSQLGLKKGDCVAVYLPNSPECIYSYLATWCLGATCVPFDFMLTEEELIPCITHAEAKILIARSKPNVSLGLIKEKCPALEHIIMVGEGKEGFLNFESVLKKGSTAFAPREIADKDYACIFYTSGTTGRPKGVLCNYRQIGAPAESMSYFSGLNDKDIALCAGLPFSHLGGLVFIQSAIFLGTTVVAMDRFIPLEVLKNIPKYKATVMWLVPSMFYAMLQLKEFESFDLSSLRWITSFGAPSSADQLRRFHAYCPNAELLHGWGMTETQGPTIVIPLGSKKIESIGLPAPWVEVKVFDDNDRELAAGEIGEIVVRSWIVTDGYYKDSEATEMAKRNGWFHTGDLGRFDDEGYLYISGRKKEMIKVAGEIVFEPEIESALHKHPEIAEAAVIGVADKLRGEVPKAIVVLKEGSQAIEEDLRYFLRQHLAHFKIPHYFEFRTSLPKNRAGKVDKEGLRKEGVSA